MYGRERAPVVLLALGLPIQLEDVGVAEVPLGVFLPGPFFFLILRPLLLQLWARGRLRVLRVSSA